MAAAWLPPKCRDEELSNKWATKGNYINGTWNYWADYNRTERLTEEEVAMLGGTKTKFYMDWNWHVGHCVYYWEKSYRTSFTGVTLEPRYNKGGHISHCTDVIFSDKSLTSNAGVVLSSTDD